MSIIEETLNRLGKERSGRAGTQADAQALIGVGFASARATPRSSSPLRLMRLAGLAAIVLSVVGWFAFRWLDTVAPRATASPQPDSIASPAAPASREAAVAAVMPQPPEPVQPAPLAAADAAQSASVPAAAPVSMSTPLSSPVPATLPMASPLEVPSAPVSVPMRDASHAAHQLPEADMASSETLASSPPWLSHGFRLLAGGNVEGALQVWNEGFASLGPRQRIGAIAAFPDQGAAMVALKRIGDVEGAFIAFGSYRGIKAWHLLVLSDPGRRLGDLARAAELTGIKGGGVVQVSDVILSAPNSIPRSQKAADPVASRSTLKVVHQSVPPARETRNPVASPVPVTETTASKKDRAAGSAAQSAFVFDRQSERVIHAMNNGNHAEAAEIARSLLSQYGSHAEPWFWVGKAELGLGNFDEAERHLTRATDIAPAFSEAWVLRGIAAQERGDHSLALKFLTEAQAISPNQADIYFNVGYSQDALGRREEADAAWRRFLDLARDKPRFAKQRAFVEQRFVRAR